MTTEKRQQQTEPYIKDTPHPSPHNILIMGVAFSRSLWPHLFTFHRFHCRYLFAWNRPVNRLPGLWFVPSSPLGNSVPVWYRSLHAAFVSPSCTNHGFLPGMSHLLSVCGTEQALCTCWYNTTDQSFYTRIPDPPRGLIKLSMSCRCTKKSDLHLIFSGRGRGHTPASRYCFRPFQATHDVSYRCVFISPSPKDKR